MPRRAPSIELTFPIRAELFAKIDRAVREAGYAPAIDWCENIEPPATAAQFASEIIYVILNSGLSNAVAVPIFAKCMSALQSGNSVTTVFGHPGKAKAIDLVWRDRASLFRQLKKASNLVDFCATLPWIGPITRFHLARNLGADVAKPDVHLNRLADAEGITPQELCERLGGEAGYRAGTVDLILWRAAANGIIHTRN